jgi:hypothetical protein
MTTPRIIHIVLATTCGSRCYHRPKPLSTTIRPRSSSDLHSYAGGAGGAGAPQILLVHFSMRPGSAAGPPLPIPHTTSATAGRGTRRGLPNSANKAPRLAHSASPVHPLTRCWSGETKFACCVFLACHTRRSRPDSQPRKPLLPVCRSRLCSSLQSHVTLSMCTFRSTLPAVVSIPICSHLAFRTRIASCVHDSRPISLTPSSS